MHDIPTTPPRARAALPYTLLGAETPVSEYPSQQLMRRIERDPFPANIGALMEDRARRFPDKVLLDLFEDGVELTYSQFAGKVRRLASGFVELGIGRGTHVGVMVNTTQTYPITWFALGLLGATIVPINYGYTSRELAYVLSDSDATFLVIEDGFLPLLEAITPALLPRDRVIVDGEAAGGYLSWARLLAEGDAAFMPEAEPEQGDVWNIQYTSGTTGFPKGAMLTHLGLMMHGRVGAAQSLDLATNLLIAQPFHYITAQWQFLTAMFQGGTAFMPRRQSSSRFMEWVRKYKIHYCNFPEIVARAPERPEDADNDLLVAYCYSHQLQNYRAHERRYGFLARQGFSMTETALVTYVPVEADHMTGTGTCGIPAASREVRICAADGTEVPPGELGELCVRGPGMLVGYYNKPEATRDAFHPGGWFRTGDLARRNEDGWIWYLGRLKDMIKRSGESISATEVEAILRGVDGVVEAAVLPVPDPDRGEEVKAYLLLEEGRTREDVDPARVIAEAAGELARFKLPRYLEYVESFPRTPGGKVKKSDLRAAKDDLRAGSYDTVAQRWLP